VGIRDRSPLRRVDLRVEVQPAPLLPQTGYSRLILRGELVDYSGSSSFWLPDSGRDIR